MQEILDYVVAGEYVFAHHQLVPVLIKLVERNPLKLCGGVGTVSDAEAVGVVGLSFYVPLLEDFIDAHCGIVSVLEEGGKADIFMALWRKQCLRGAWLHWGLRIFVQWLCRCRIVEGRVDRPVGCSCQMG